MQSSFAAWADPNFVFRMPDETPFGIDHSLHGRPIIDYQVSCEAAALMSLTQYVQPCNQVSVL